MKTSPSYAIASVDHALQLATVLQVEGSLGVKEAAERLGVARSTAHRLLTMLVYRDFAVQDDRRRYLAGPVLSLGAQSQSRTALLRTVALPHLEALVERVHETVNLQILAGDHVRFIASVECTQALRVGDRTGMVFPAHLVSGGKLMLAGLPDSQIEAYYAEDKWADRPGERPDLDALRRELRTVRERGFAINAGRTEAGLTAIGRGVRTHGDQVEAAISVSMPTVRFSEERLSHLISVLALTARDIEQDLASRG
ncbi:IclR family transcriptional regulator [Blastococcus sp. CT_GayMR16]|uniref:IclR family transcriptional regulator n=1 Tax=Blastococcus sp. CT_GayMR16 TaxID=2559607 RepID=UPI00107436DD|nr:IclR family transcriptional regulator [Blastococcus sp. CT_GayMR16]TFV85816.1 IclR family transcriptional regulator [Blastococcus sp. CT_GayMR16]